MVSKEPCVKTFYDGRTKSEYFSSELENQIQLRKITCKQTLFEQGTGRELVWIIRLSLIILLIVNSNHYHTY